MISFGRPVEQVALLLVERDPRGQLGQVTLGGTTQVPLNPEVAEERGGRPEAECADSPGGAGAWSGDVRAEHFQGEELE